MATNDDEYPGLPIKLGGCSNGEYLDPPPTPLVRETVRRARAAAEKNAKRAGMSRRRFLLSSMGAATTLAVLAACSKEQNAAPGGAPGTGAGGTRGTGGDFKIHPDAGLDPEAAYESLGGEEFIFDVQTHFLDGNHDIPDLGIGRLFPQSTCGKSDPRDCFTVDYYLDLLFNKSDTNMIVISALPFAGSPLNPDVMKRTVELADKIGCQHRVLMQGEAHPSLGNIETALDNMERLKQALPIGAWKVYTHAGAPGWWLDDHDPAAPQVGQRFIDQVRRLGPKLIAVHKGFGGVGNPPFADPVDVGPAAKANPDIDFVVYHSGFDVYGGQVIEGPYDASNNRGIDRLIRSVTGAGIGPGGNVYAELGSAWWQLMRNPTAAAHVLGKLLKHFGEDNIVWGTDSIWYGAPQDQIQSFRSFEILPEYQETFGYPPLTERVKAKIFGLNSARLYGVEPITGDCKFDRARVENARLSSQHGNATLGPRTPEAVYALRAREDAALRGGLV